MKKLVTVEQAAAMIYDDDVVAVNAMGWLANPKDIYAAVEKRFIAEQRPRNLTLMAACGVGAREQPELANRLAHEGLVGKLIIGHYDGMRSFHEMIREEKVDAYSLPQGMIAMSYREAARRSPGFYTKIGLHTAVDPRMDKAGLNERSCEEFVRVEEVDGEEYLFVSTIRPTVALIRGTTADVNGNITFEKEALLLDALDMAQAVKNNGGRVIVQVERISDSHANPQDVRIPWQLVDAVYLAPDQMQTGTELYNALYSGENYTPWSYLPQYMKYLMEKGNELASIKRLPADRIIARRAALELRKGDFVNLGIGIPTMIGNELEDMGNLSSQDIVFTLELGVTGGTPAGEISFGAMINADSIYSHASQFGFYEGGGLDISFVGALEFDLYGNINVLKTKDKLFGLGGFTYVTQAPKRLVVCSKFMQGSGWKKEKEGLVLVDGKFPKLVEKVYNVDFNGRYAWERKQSVIFITERAVFELDEQGIALVEIAPGIDVEKDILNHRSFKVNVSPILREMPLICFQV